MREQQTLAERAEELLKQHRFDPPRETPQQYKLRVRLSIYNASGL
jgi:hypothetical protein